MSIIVLSVVAYFFFMGLLLVALLLSSREGKKNAANRTATDAASILRQLGLGREKDCGFVCTLGFCRGQNPIIRRICGWLNRKPRKAERAVPALHQDSHDPQDL